MHYIICYAVTMWHLKHLQHEIGVKKALHHLTFS